MPLPQLTTVHVLPLRWVVVVENWKILHPIHTIAS
jgi:hypothetical protein